MNLNEDMKSINWFPGHMAKAKRELEENIQYALDLNDKRFTNFEGGKHTMLDPKYIPLFVGGFIGFFVYLNGSNILNLFRINFKSFNEVKGFVLKVLVLLLLMFVILSIFVSFFIKTVVLLKERNIKKGYSVVQESVEEVVFDSNDIPNIKDDFSHAKFLESINSIDGFSFSNLAEGGC